MAEVIRFSKAEFEAALAAGLRQIVDKLGYDAKLGHTAEKGEHVYNITIAGTNKRLRVRSSVDLSTGLASDTGNNSIRIWGEYWYGKAQSWLSLGKPDAWTTREPGWEGRMLRKIELVFVDLLKDSRKSIPGPGASGQEDVKSVAEKENGNSRLTTASCPGDTRTGVIKLGAQSPQQQNEDEDEDLPRTLAVVGGTGPSVKPVAGKEPNASQKRAINAPLGAIRVMAPPGSGKTFVIERRYGHLLEMGIDPRNIFAVTFSASMAADAYARIKAANPQIVGTVAEQQICTIHALCFRMLKSEGDRRNVAPNWKIKGLIQERIVRLWPSVEMRPNWQEVYQWICAAKSAGLDVDQDGDFFEIHLGLYHGERMDVMRQEFDTAMKREGLLTFQDMLLDIELKLRNDPEFRTRWQSRVLHLIIDEAQDTGRQALRILITLSLDPGKSLDDFAGDE